MAKRVMILALWVLVSWCQRGWTLSSDHLPDQMMPLVIEAPADTSINATMPGCWAMIELPMATIVMNGCMGPVDFSVETPFDTLIGNGGKTSFQLGTHDVIYIAQDTCGNMDMDTMQVTVIDTVPPTAVCTGLKTVSLDGNGMAILPAFVFDGGSTDACFLYYKVKRLVPPSGYDCTTQDNPNYQFDDEVKFCCEDLNDTVMVVLRVYDTVPPPGPVADTTLAGRFSDCMTGVIIRDKAPPILTCPPDITIECGEHIDFDTLGLPTVSDNCDSISFEINIVRDIDQCGTGQFRRVIIGTDGGGQTDTCTQIIFVENNEPFDGNDTMDLRWPEPYVTVYDCIFVPDTSLAGGPVIMDDECSMVSVSWTDEVYSFSRGACSKVIRTFKVLDWCQYDPKVSSACTPANGCWTFEQIIKVIDTIPPTITRPNDTIVDYLKPGCTDMLVQLDSATADTCFFGEEIDFSVEIDFFMDGTIDVTIDGPDATFVYPVGKHFVIYFATDECGNTTIDTMTLEVKDRVLPTPIAKTGLSIGLTDMGGGLVMTSVWARDLNASSYDNCTNASDLIFSFSPDTSDKVRVFDCDSVGVRQVRLWVTDKCGNQDFVTTSILVDDTGDHCPTMVRMSSISGTIRRHDGMKLPLVDMALYHNGQQRMTATDDEGDYMHDQLERQQNYKIEPAMTGDVMAGITTRDVVLIQRHLLGIEDFDQTYQFLGGDVNRSGHISTSDIILLRKLILGRIQAFPHGEEWIFMPNTWTFSNPTDPWASPWPSDFKLNNLNDPEKVDFRGYKIGDVDMSYAGFNHNTTRSEGMRLTMEFDKETSSLVLINHEERWLTGFQLSLKLVDYSSKQVEVGSTLDQWSDENYHFNASTGILTISWQGLGAQWCADDEFLWISSGSGSTDESFSALLTDQLRAEAYNQNIEVLPIDISSGRDTEGLSLVKISPNPFESELNIEFYHSKSETIELRLVDLLGRTVMERRVNSEKGWNILTLDVADRSREGVYVLQLGSSSGRQEFRVIKSR